MAGKVLLVTLQSAPSTPMASYAVATELAILLPENVIVTITYLSEALLAVNQDALSVVTIWNAVVLLELTMVNPCAIQARISVNVSGHCPQTPGPTTRERDGLLQTRLSILQASGDLPVNAITQKCAWTTPLDTGVVNQSITPTVRFKGLLLLKDTPVVTTERARIWEALPQAWNANLPVNAHWSILR